MTKALVWPVVIPLVAGLAACAPVKVSPELSASLGLSAFEAMGKINPRPIPIAVYLSPELVNLRFGATIRDGTFTFPVGQALSTKLLKALSYQFQTIYVASTIAQARAEPAKALLTLTPGPVESHFGVQPGLVKVGATAFVRLPIRAQLTDVDSGRVLWVGASQVQEHTDYEEVAKMTYQEAGTGFATAVNAAVDDTVGNLVHQLVASPEFAAFAGGSQ